MIEALTGGVEEHHRFLLAMQLGRIEAIEADIAALDARVAERLLPYSAEMTLLMTIPGVIGWSARSSSPRSART